MNDFSTETAEDFERTLILNKSRGLMVMTFRSHRKGSRFDPGRDYEAQFSLLPFCSVNVDIVVLNDKQHEKRLYAFNDLQYCLLSSMLKSTSNRRE